MREHCLDGHILSVPKFVNKLISILIIFIVCSAGSLWGYAFRPVALYIISGLVIFQTSIRKKPQIRVLPLIYIGALLINLYTSSKRDDTLMYIILVISMLSISLLNFEQRIWENIFKCIYYFSLLVAISVYIQAIAPDLFYEIFWLLKGPSKAYIYDMQERAGQHQLAGIAFEIAEAAVLCNYGLAYKCSKFFCGYKLQKKDIVEAFVLFGALILTTKRMLFAIPFLIFALFILIKKGDLIKKIKFVIASLVVAGVIVFVLLNVPMFGTIVERFMDSNNLDSYGGREILWMLSSYMYKVSPINGLGYATYNYYAGLYGLPEFYGHNIYLQLLGEGGIIGLLLVMGFYVSILIYSIYLVRKNDNNAIIWFCLYIQIMYFIYGITGNVLSYIQQISMWIVVCCCVLNIGKESKSEC